MHYGKRQWDCRTIGAQRLHNVISIRLPAATGTVHAIKARTSCLLGREYHPETALNAGGMRT